LDALYQDRHGGPEYRWFTAVTSQGRAVVGALAGIRCPPGQDALDRAAE